jgi:hypothetical protein
LRWQAPRNRAVETGAACSNFSVGNHLDDELEVRVRADVAGLADMQQGRIAVPEPDLMPKLGDLEILRPRQDE